MAERLERELRRSGRGLKATVNDALRRGLGMTGRRARAPRFTVQPHPMRVKAGIDLDRMNQLVDELDAEAARRTLTS